MDLDVEESRVRAVIFDLDGVICDTEPLHVISWRILFAKRGIEVPEAYLKTGIGITDLEFLRTFFERYDIKGDPNLWQLEKRNIYLGLLQHKVPEFPGAVALVKRLYWNWPLGLASSSWRISIETITRRLAIRRHFAAIIGKEDVTEHKPSPEPFLAAAAELEIDPVRCAVIEDSIAGIEAAKGAGMLCIAVTNSYPADKLSDADLIVTSLEDAAPILSLLSVGP